MGASKPRCLVYSPDRSLEPWIDSELDGETLIVQAALSARQVVRALVDDPPPRAQLLITEFASMSALDALLLHQLRERGWFGAIIAIGGLSADLKKSLRIELVVRSRVRGALRSVVANVNLDRPTVRMERAVR